MLRVGAVTTFSGRQFQGSIILLVKKCCLSAVRHICLFKFNEWPLVMLLVFLMKNVSVGMSESPLNNLIGFYHISPHPPVKQCG